MGIDGKAGGELTPLYRRLPYGPKRIEREEVARNQRARLYGAMIEAVHQRGYPGTTVAHVIALAGVSRRAFYEQFRNKEHCFLATYDIVVARQRKLVIDSCNGEQGWTNRLHAGCKSLLDDVATNPKGARLVLVEALAVGSPARERMHLAGLAFERLLASVFAIAPEEAALPPLAPRAVVGAVRQIVLLRVLEGRQTELRLLTDEVIDWIESYRSPAAARLGAGARSAAPASRSGAAPSHSGAIASGSGATPPPSGAAAEEPGGRAAFLQGDSERARALRSLVDLTLGEGYARVSEVQLARRAGISVGTFHEHFSDTGQCLLAALDEFFGEALVAARDALERGTAWPQAVDSAMRAFVGHLVADPDLLRIAFVDLFELGPGIVGRLAGWVEAFIGLLTKAGPPPRRGPALALEAVTGAIWAVMATYVAGDRPARLPALTEQLTFLVLAPYIGPKAAIEAIQQTGMQPRAA